MTETGFFTSGGNELAYTCVIPTQKNRAVGVLFVHAAGGNRLGPHRMFVELARKFNAMGYATFRFDLSGSGDSSGTYAECDLTTEISDVDEAVRFFKTMSKIESVVTLGISRGARVCHELAVRHEIPLAGMILLSTPVSSRTAALKTFQDRLKGYCCKLKDPKSLWKLLSGRANVSHICKTLVHALKLSGRFKTLEERSFASRCPILFVYGENDPIAGESNRHYSNICRQNNLPYDCHVVANANHSFFHYKWKEDIFTVSKEWLETHCKS